MPQMIRAAGLLVAALAAARPLAADVRPFTQTGAGIRQRQEAAERVQGPRPASPRFASPRRMCLAPPPLAAGRPSRPPVAVPAPSAPQTFGTSFLGAQLTDPNAFPPDTMGAVGPTQFLVGVNGRLRSFDKAFGDADGGLDADLDVFFDAVRNGQPTFAPRVRYDRLSGRWIVTALNFGATLSNNRVLVAASDSATISAATLWVLSYFEHDLDFPTGDTDDYFDVGSLGVDANALVIGGNLFDETGAYRGTSVHVVRKSAILSDGGNLLPSNVVAYRNLTATPDGEGPYTPQGVDEQNDESATASWVVGVNNVLPVTSELVLRKITYSAAGAWPPLSISANLVLSVPVTALPLTVPHLGNTGGADGQLDALDDRLGDAKLRSGHIWTAHQIAVDATGAGADTGDRDAVRWYDIDVTGDSLVLSQAGTLFDGAASNPRFYWMPSIMVTGQGHAAIGASAAGATEYANGVTAGRLADDPAGTLEAPARFTSSAASYNPAADPGPARRWGDYSYTSLDPGDDMTLWTIQEYCNAQDSWGVRVVELLAPPPATPVTATPASVAAGQASVVVVVTGLSAGGAAFFDSGTGYAKRFAASVSNGVTVNTATVTGPASVTLDLNTVGAPLGGRRITAANPDGQSRTSASPILTVTTSGAGPTVGAIAPASGDAAAAIPMTLTGGGFATGASISIGVVAAADAQVASATSAAATTPPLSPGTLNDVTLVNPDMQSGTLYAAWFADFLDVPGADPFHARVESIFRAGVTAGCAPGLYCRDTAVTRAQIAVFLLKAKYGGSHVPPGCTGLFSDVDCPSSFADWIEELYTLRVTGGCKASPLAYCPGSPVTRAQMAVFLLKASLGSIYAPNDCTGLVFTDVPCSGSVFDPWIEDLAGRGITGGCGGGAYCPSATITRGQMAVFLAKTFGLP